MRVLLLPRERLFATTLLVLAPAAAGAVFLPQPVVEWTVDLPQNSGLLRGNSVAASPKNGGKVYAATAEGNLHIVTAETQQVQTYQPDLVPRADFVSCQTGVAVVETAGGNEYAVYAVTDTYSFQRRASRVIAVNSDGSQRWEVSISGTVVGTPLIGGARQDRIYVIHNDEDSDARRDLGYVTVIAVDGDFAAATATLPDPRRQSSPQPRGSFGPGTLRTVRTEEQGQVDVVFFAESRLNGFSESGSLYALVPSASYQELSGTGNASYEFLLISSDAMSAVTKPAVTANLDVFLGQYASTISGWTDRGGFSELLATGDWDTAATWSSELRQDRDNEESPIQSSPVLSTDGQFLFAAAAGPEVVCIETATGEILWEERTDGITLASPIYSVQPNEEGVETPVVYFVEADRATLTQHEAESGRPLWELSCNQLRSCQGPIEADFSLSADGSSLFFGDAFGRIVALRVAETPTEAPSAAPSSGAPVVVVDDNATDTGGLDPGAPSDEPGQQQTAEPTASPVQSPVVDRGEINDQVGANQSENSANSLSDNLPILIGPVCGGLALLLLLFLYCRRKNKVKAAKVEKHTSEKTVEDREVQQNEPELKNECVVEEAGTLNAILASSPEKSGGTAKSSGTPKTVDMSLQSIEEEETPDDTFRGDDSSSIASFVLSLASSVIPGISPSPSKDQDESITTEASKKDIEQGQAERVVPTVNTTRQEEKKDEEPSSPVQEKNSPVQHPAPVAADGDHEPGHIVPGERPVSPVMRAASPGPDDLFSVDDSLYLDEDVLESPVTPLVKDALEVGPAITDDLPSDGPEDEFSSVLRPGSHYLSRHKKQSLQAIPKLQDSRPRQEAPVYQKRSEERSATPTRPRAGIFSRRQEPLKSVLGEPKTGDDSPDGPAPDPPAQSKVHRGESARDKANRSLQLKAATARKQKAEDNKHESKPASEPKATEDAWAGFLTELAKVEKQFFSNPTASSDSTKKKKKRKSRSTRSPPPPPPLPRKEDDESCDTNCASTDAVPPAPRTLDV